MSTRVIDFFIICVWLTHMNQTPGISGYLSLLIQMMIKAPSPLSFQTWLAVCNSEINFFY